jgi:hypothetical protein
MASACEAENVHRHLKRAIADLCRLAQGCGCAPDHLHGLLLAPLLDVVIIRAGKEDTIKAKLHKKSHLSH